MKERTNEKGVAAVEFAIVLPVLIVLIFGIVEFGLLLYNRQVITNASREGCRAGIVQRTPKRTADEIEAIVNNYSASNLITFAPASDPVTTVTGAGGSFSEPLTVRVEYTYTFLILPNFVSGLLGGISAETVMLHE